MGSSYSCHGQTSRYGADIVVTVKTMHSACNQYLLQPCNYNHVNVWFNLNTLTINLEHLNIQSWTSQQIDCQMRSSMDRHRARVDALVGAGMERLVSDHTTPRLHDLAQRTYYVQLDANSHQGFSIVYLLNLSRQQTAIVIFDMTFCKAELSLLELERKY